MDFELSDTQRAVVAAARAFAEKRAAPAAAENDRAGHLPEALVRELGALGMLAVNVPAAYGGSEAGAVAYALAVMEIAAADCSLAVTMAVTNMVGGDHRALRDRRAEGALPAVAGLGRVAGRRVRALRAARRQRRGGDAHPGGAARRGLGAERLEAVDHERRPRRGVRGLGPDRPPRAGRTGLSAFLVEGGTPGLVVGRREDKMGLRASSTVALSLEDCEVPADALLGGEGQGFRIALTALDGGRIGIAAQATGTMRAALEASVRYARDRRAFGQAIAGFQAISGAIADMRTAHDAAWLLTLRAAALKEASRPFTREASMAKLFASEAAQKVVSKAVQIHGGYGYCDAFPVERYFRDARVQTIYEGTSEIQRLVIAREILQGQPD